MQSDARPVHLEEKNIGLNEHFKFIELLAKKINDHFSPALWASGINVFLPKMTETDLEAIKKNLNEVLAEKIQTEKDLDQLRPSILRNLFTNDFGKQALKEKLITLEEARDLLSSELSRLITEKGLQLLRNTKGIIPVKELAKLGFFEAPDSYSDSESGRYMYYTELDMAIINGNINGIQKKTADTLGGAVKQYYEKQLLAVKNITQDETAVLSNDERSLLQFRPGQ